MKKICQDFTELITFHQCPDKDLVQRLSGLKQDPETGQFYNRDQWQREEVYNKEKKSKEQDAEDAEDLEEQVLLKGK